MKKSKLELALQRAQVALHESSLEVGRLNEIETRLKAGLKDWSFTNTDKDMILLKATPELMSLLPPR